MIIFCFALAWALQRAGEQWWNDTRSELRAARVRIGRRTAAWKSRHKPYHPGRVALALGKGAYLTTRTGYRVVRFSGRSLAVGARAGWAEGRKRAEERAARRAERDSARDVPTAESGAARVCPRCGRPAVYQRPTTLAGYEAMGIPVPEFSHADGTPLCAVAGEPTQPLAVANLDAAKDSGAHAAGEPEETPSTGGTVTSQLHTGEAVNIAAARDALDAILKIANDAVSSIDNLSASLQNADMDVDTLSEVAEVLESATAMQAAAENARKGIDARHAVMEEAVNATPHAAKTDFYRH